MRKILLLAMMIPAVSLAHEYGPDPRYTGAPGDHPLACATAMCHTSETAGGPINAISGGAVAATFSSSTYTPGGAPITITVNVMDPQNTHFGFQMTARPESDLANGQAGTFTPGPNQLVICVNGAPRLNSCPASAPIEFIEHAYPQNSQVGTTPYTFTWMPPATDIGPVHFYVAGNAVNGDLKADGKDHVYTANYVLSPVPCATAPPVISKVISASAFGSLASFASGSWIEIYGSNFAVKAQQWSGSDFNGANAPTSLGGVSASINGKPGYVYFVNDSQVNVQAPADATTGPVSVAVTNCLGASDPLIVPKDALAPGLLAPTSFLIGGKQYLVALFASDGAYVGNPGLIPGLTFRPAKPGDSITTYGIGFGDVIPAVEPGVVVGDDQLNSLSNPLDIEFGSTPAETTYDGLAPSAVGLYQFNITVPDVPPGDVPINFTLNGVPLEQKLYLTVGQ